MRLYEAGLLDIDAPSTTYLPLTADCACRLLAQRTELDAVAGMYVTAHGYDAVSRNDTGLAAFRGLVD